jgi:hypothetical protein
VETAVKAFAAAGDATRLKIESHRGIGLSRGTIGSSLLSRAANPCLVYVTAFEEVRLAL